MDSSRGHRQNRAMAFSSAGVFKKNIIGRKVAILLLIVVVFQIDSGHGFIQVLEGGIDCLYLEHKSFKLFRIKRLGPIA